MATGDFRIKYKILLYVFKAVHGTAPARSGHVCPHVHQFLLKCTHKKYNNPAVCKFLFSLGPGNLSRDTDHMCLSQSTWTGTNQF